MHFQSFILLWSSAWGRTQDWTSMAEWPSLRFSHKQNTIAIWPRVWPLTLCYTVFSMSAVISFVSGIPFSQWLCLSSVFSTNLFFIPPHPWHHLDFVSTVLSSVPLRGVVDCTVAHSAVIQCYWGCYNSVLCDQEPHSPGSCTLWQTTEGRLGINGSATLRGCDESNFFNLLYYCVFQAGCWVYVSQCSLPCGWVSLSQWRV